MKLEVRTVKTRPRKLIAKWKIAQEDDAGFMYAPNIPAFFEKIEKTIWCDWEEQFIWKPRRSIYGKIIWGRVQYRHEMNAWGKVPLTGGVKQWATKKEVFESKLRGDREHVEVDTNSLLYDRKTANV